MISAESKIIYLVLFNTVNAVVEVDIDGDGGVGTDKQKISIPAITQNNNEFESLYELQHTFKSSDTAFGYSVAGVGENVLVGTVYSGNAYLYDGNTGELLYTFSQPESDGFGFRVAGIGDKALISSSQDDKVFLYDGNTGELIYTFSNPGVQGFGFGIAGKDNRVLIGDYAAKKVFIYDINTFELINTISSPNPFTYNYGSVAVWEDKILVGASISKKAFLHDLNTGELLYTFSQPNSDGFGYTVNGMGDKVIIGAPLERKAYLYHIATGELLFTFSNPDSKFFGYSVASVGNNVLVGAMGTREVYLYDGNTGELLYIFNNPDSNQFGNSVASIGDKVLIGAYYGKEAFLYTPISSNNTIPSIDSISPIVTPPDNIVAEATGPETIVDIGTATATDNVGVVSLTNDAPSTFHVGTTTITWTAKDAAENKGTALQKITVLNIISYETTTITGTILYNGKPIIGFTEKQPKFWARDENSGKAFPIDPNYNDATGKYTIPNVPPGKYGIQINIDDAEPFNTGNGFAGDFEGWNSPIVVSEGQSTLQKDLNVQKNIHLTSPVDNSKEIGHFGAEKDSYYQGELEFKWDAIPEAISYKVSVKRYAETYTYLENILSITSEDTNLTTELPLNEDNHFYLFKLYAYNDNDLMVGKLEVKYDNAYG